MSPSQLDIMFLGLRGNALLAARELALAHPDVHFTDGHRSTEDQADRMAANIVRSGDRGWIGKTYLAAAKCQQWVSDHPEATTRAELKAGILSILESLSVDELAHISKHLSGDAFDVRIVIGAWGQAILRTLETIVKKYGGRLITNEGGKFVNGKIVGGIPVWHAQF